MHVAYSDCVHSVAARCRGAIEVAVTLGTVTCGFSLKEYVVIQPRKVRKWGKSYTAGCYLRIIKWCRLIKLKTQEFFAKIMPPQT